MLLKAIESCEVLIAIEALTQKVGALESTLRDCAIADRPAPAAEGRNRALFFDIPIHPTARQPTEDWCREVRVEKPALPDPRVIRRIIRQRRLRSNFFNVDLFADPAWEMILDLAAAAVEGKQVAITSLCIASCVPPSTALRWIKTMTEHGLVQRQEDPRDQRRVFIALTNAGLNAVVRYFEMLGSDAKMLV